MSQKEGGDFADFQAKSPIVCVTALQIDLGTIDDCFIQNV